MFTYSIILFFSKINDIDLDKPYCYFENFRSFDKAKIVSIPRDRVFKITERDNNSYEYLMIYRIQKGYNIFNMNKYYWDNGYYVSFKCRAAYDGDYELSWNELERHVGKYINIYKID